MREGGNAVMEVNKAERSERKLQTFWWATPWELKAGTCKIKPY